MSCCCCYVQAKGTARMGGRTAGIKTMLEFLCGGASGRKRPRSVGGGQDQPSASGGGGKHDDDTILNTYYSNAAVRPLLHLCFCLCL